MWPAIILFVFLGFHNSLLHVQTSADHGIIGKKRFDLRCIYNITYGTSLNMCQSKVTKVIKVIQIRVFILVLLRIYGFKRFFSTLISQA